jgi:hypothetical protein
MVRILLCPTYSYELEAYLDVRNLPGAGEHATRVRGSFDQQYLDSLILFVRWEPQLAQPGYQHPQLQGQYGQNVFTQNAGYSPGYQPNYTQPQK